MSTSPLQLSSQCSIDAIQPPVQCMAYTALGNFNFHQPQLSQISSPLMWRPHKHTAGIDTRLLNSFGLSPTSIDNIYGPSTVTSVTSNQLIYYSDTIDISNYCTWLHYSKPPTEQFRVDRTWIPPCAHSRCIMNFNYNKHIQKLRAHNHSAPDDSISHTVLLQVTLLYCIPLLNNNTFLETDGISHLGVQ